MKQLGALVAVCVACVACGAAAPTPYGVERARAERAYRDGDFRAAAQHWARAAERAQSPHERSEAEYRRAATLERGGELAEAEAAYTAIERGAGERAARAAFSRAALVLERGAVEEGFDLLWRACLRFPDSAFAPRAALRILERVARARGEQGAIEEAERLLAAVQGRELEETLWFERAKRLERSGNAPAALGAYLELAGRFPYPRGAYWDDALLAAAELEVAAGKPERALAHLERLLREREAARISGSYERKTFAEARFRIAEIVRDELGDPKRARSEFRRVFAEHPTSRLGDDGLFEEALLALHSDGNACPSAKLFRERAQHSRYARCVHELCPALPAPPGRACPTYALERIRAAKAPPGAHPPSSSSSSSSSSR